MSGRIYLDWNAAAPLRREAREAVLAAMDVGGNPSSVHAEGRAARAVVERARAQVAALVGAEPDAVVFTAGASEAVATAIAAHDRRVHVSPTAHDCLTAWLDDGRAAALVVDRHGRAALDGFEERVAPADLVGVSWASGETGIVEDGMLWRACLDHGVVLLRDMAQAAGRMPVDAKAPGSDYVVLSSGKLGGPRGVGALVARDGLPARPLIPGGGQEGRRRSGTENVAGIAGFGAAAEAARRELDSGVWSRVEKLRDILESRLEAAVPDTIFVGRGARRLPNTSCFAVPGWPGEVQVIQLDLAGFAISAGSACSSGKVSRSRALEAMGLGAGLTGSAIRVSIGPATTEAEVVAFVEAWADHYRRRRARAA
ncbi:MAG TPA: cysteine desulfurase family protein [Thermohalobaculum sp.]|nr:cysteine desulfurase family protein [Thermohalobaculum sp.]